MNMRYYLPRSIAADDADCRAIDSFARYLKYIKTYTETKDCSTADFLLIENPIHGLLLDPNRIATYVMPGQKVGLVQSPNRRCENISPYHVTEISCLDGGPLQALDKFIDDHGNTNKDMHVSSLRHRLGITQIKGILKKALGDRLDFADDDLFRSMAKVKKLEDDDNFVNFIKYVFNSEDKLNWWLGIDLVACDVAIQMHNQQSFFDKPFSDGLEDAAREFQARRFIEVCEDLAATLATRIYPPNAGRDKILVIDDRANNDQAIELLEHTHDIFLADSGFRFHHINPLQEDCKIGSITLLDYICGYSTLSDHHSNIDQVRKFIELLNQSAYVLVDQMYTRDDGDSEFIGPAFIRGLNRFMRDHCKYDKGGDVPPAEILALSKSSDVDRILEAFRSGAKDYVLKGRMLGLPAVLSRVSYGTVEPLGRYHRNFRSLYDLPNETIGLLRSARIPRIQLDQYQSKQNRDEGIDGGSFSIGRHWSDLLSALPKPDLHVHVASCMSPEFLVISSLVGLLSIRLEYVSDAFKLICQAIEGKWKPIVPWSGSPLPYDEDGFREPDKWMANYGNMLRKHLTSEVEIPTGDRANTNSLRALLHQELGLPSFAKNDELLKKIDKCKSLDLVLFFLRHQIKPSDESAYPLGNDDLKKVYILVLAMRQDAKLMWKSEDVFAILSGVKISKTRKKIWQSLCDIFYKKDVSLSKFKDNGWNIPDLSKSKSPLGGSLRLEMKPNEPDDHICAKLLFDENPIDYILASGQRCDNLVEYLEGFEFAGAEHLRHPFLLHLFAQQALVNFIKKGALYVELRGSPDGYVNPLLKFEFTDVCICLQASFTQAQKLILDQSNDGWIAGILGSRFNQPKTHEPRGDKSLGSLNTVCPRPCKVSLVFVGKRHKSMREMIIEAAAAAVMKPAASHQVSSAARFVTTEMYRCRVVGFDLAGPEEGYPPAEFIDEFARLSRLHIPLTVHAGENASAQFVEDAILDLGARRVGHGLSLIEDKGLMGRVREERVCVELCPVSNHQTSRFSDPKDGKGRPYPLKEYLRHGILVTLGTDNPNISYTNLVKEYFQASYAYDEKGLPLWEALRIMRMGFIASFLNMTERRALLEIAEQHIFDLFSNDGVVSILRELVLHQKSLLEDDTAEMCKTTPPTE